MITLSQYITESKKISTKNWKSFSEMGDIAVHQNTIDGHCHLFDSDEITYDYAKHSLNKIVGFLDIEPKYLSRYSDCVSLYDNFITNHYDKKKHILCATALTADQMIEIAKKWPKIIKGFGEIKCYDEWKGKPLKLKGLMQYWDVFKYAAEHDMPVYLHYSLTKDIDVERLDKCLTRFPQTKFVLCHCGMDEFQENLSETFAKTLNLMTRHGNLYADISYVALDFFSKNPILINQLPLDRTIVGSDLNPMLYTKLDNSAEVEEGIFDKLNSIDKYVHSDNAIHALFRTKTEQISKQNKKMTN